MGRILVDKRTIAGSTNNTKTTTYQYNLDGSIFKLTYPGTGDTVTYTVGGAGRETAAQDVANSLNYVTNAHYEAFGGITGMTHSGTITEQNSYTNRLQPLLISAAAGSTSLISLCYDFHSGQAWSSGPCSFPAYTSGDNGDVYQIVNNRDGNRTKNFTYDGLNRIATAYTNGANWGETYTIDPWGNLNNRGPVAGKTNYEGLSAAATPENQLTGYVYDAAGNLTGNGTYVYDAENHLVYTSGHAYFYDADGTRVKNCTSAAAFTCASGATGTLYWDGAGSDSLTEGNLSGSTYREYIFFNGKLAARLSPPTTARYFFSDNLGSDDLFVNANGTIQRELDFYPYGGEIFISGSGTEPHEFTGKERDPESQLDNFGARYDASSLGRFMTPDWSGSPESVPYANFGDPQSLNLYSYVRNNPASLYDPYGHCWTFFGMVM